MKRISWFFSLILMLSLAVSACQTASQSSPTTTPTSTATLHPTPDCPNYSSFGNFSEVNPQNLNQIQVGYPFQWFYSFRGFEPGSVDAWADQCVPSSYTVVFSSGPDFEDEIRVPVSSPTIHLDSVKMTVTWSLPDVLKQMNFYRWVVIGDYGNIHIWYGKPGTLHDDSKWPPKSTSYNMGVFFLGTSCSSDGMETPILDTPLDGAVISDRDPLFRWHYTSCVPAGTTLVISVLPDLDGLPAGFSSTADADYTFVHGSIAPQWEYRLTEGYHWPPLPDCGTVYWRVRGRTQMDNALSDWSETRSFTVNSGICPTPTSPFSQNPTSYAPYIITVPSSTPTAKPTSQPKPTDTQVPPSPTTPSVVCEGLSQGACEDTSLCEWVEPPTEAGYCTDAP